MNMSERNCKLTKIQLLVKSILVIMINYVFCRRDTFTRRVTFLRRVLHERQFCMRVKKSNYNYKQRIKYRVNSDNTKKDKINQKKVLIRSK